MVGEKIKFNGGKWTVPDNPSILFASGDGIGPEVSASAKMITDAAVSKSYAKSKRIEWIDIEIGEVAEKRYGNGITESAKKMLTEYRVLLKGPLTTPVGSGSRSFNVAIRMLLDLYANIRPVRYIKGIESPIKRPENVDMVIFRENTDDIYRGIEWRYDSKEAERLREILKRDFKVELEADTGIGIKPISRMKTERITRMAMNYAITNRRRSITIMHKGNIMKYTEGAFREWAYGIAKSPEFADRVVIESEMTAGASVEGKILINDRIADNMMQQIITRPESYDVILAPNLDGDYISDEAGALIGNISVLGSANIGDTGGMFEAAHGSVPKYAGMDLANPMGMIKAAELMLTFMGWNDAADRISKAVDRAISDRTVTADIAKYMGVKPMGTKAFTQVIIDNINGVTNATPSSAP